MQATNLVICVLFFSICLYLELVQLRREKMVGAGGGMDTGKCKQRNIHVAE